MVDEKILSDWIQKADEDFGFASLCLNDEIEYFGHICFHFQQGAEKFLKAFIVAQNLPLRKIHNLLVLLDVCCQEDGSLAELREACINLNRFYVDTRYPVHWPTNFTHADAKSAGESCEIVGSLIKKKIAAK